MPVTTKDIARICGVSRATVDRALNNKLYIKEEVKERILKVAQELGYQPDLLARSLVKGKTKSLGVVVFDVNNRFFAQMVNTIEMRAKKAGYFIYITLSEKEPQMEKELIRHLTARRVDGVILSPINKGAAFDEFLKKQGLPIVAISNRISGQWPFVGLNDAKAAKLGAEYIKNKGYRQIIYLAPPLVAKKDNIYAQEKRLEGFLESFNDDSTTEYITIASQDYLNMLDGLIARTDKKTAVFCSSDVFALKVLIHLKESGKRVPQDIGLMGFDNIDTLKYVSPRLTTICNPIEEMAVKAVECLFDQIEGRPVSMSQLLEPHIIEGESL